MAAGLLCTGVAIAQDSNRTDTASGTLAPIEVEGETRVETATGPVEGYVAERARSATKTDASLAETPQSVSVIASDQIEAQNARDIRQVLRYVSGVVPELRGNVASRYDQLTLRGFQPDTYLDGLKQLGYFYTIPKTDPYLLERVEVVKGPASVLYGQTPPGGLINLVSKRPTQEQVNEFYLETGNDSRAGAGFDIGGKLDEQGDALYRVVATGTRRDGPKRRSTPPTSRSRRRCACGYPSRPSSRCWPSTGTTRIRAPTALCLIRARSTRCPTAANCRATSTTVTRTSKASTARRSSSATSSRTGSTTACSFVRISVFAMPRSTTAASMAPG